MNSRPERGLIFLGLSALAPVAALVALAAADIALERRRTMEMAYNRLDNLARIADEVISGRLRAVDSLLQDAGRAEQAAETPQERDALQVYLAARAEPLEEVRNIIVTEADGEVSLSTLPLLMGLNAAGRDYYEAARSAPDRLALAGPRLAPSTGATVLFAARAKPARDGLWDGAAIASMPPAYFASVLDTVKLPYGFAALLNAKGEVIAEVFDQHNLLRDRMGAPLTPPPQMRQTARLAEGDDGGESFVKVWRVAQFPQLFIAVGWSEDAVLAEWRRKSAVKAAVVGVLALLALLVFRRFARHESDLRRERNLACRAEAERAVSQRFICTVADHVPGVIGYWDAGLICRFANRAYVDWFGKSPEEMVGKPLRDVLGDTLYQQNLPQVRSVLAGEPQDFERTVPRPDGSLGYAWAHYVPDRDGSGEIVGFYVLVNDITPLKRTELQLRSASSRLALAASAAGVGIWEYDPHSRESVWDDRMYQIYGLAPGDRSHSYSLWAQALHPADLVRVQREFDRAVESGGDFVSEFRILTPGGEIRHIRSAAKAELDADGSPERFIGVNWDITAIRRNEAALAAARAAAESANRAKSEFLANMSHEIRTPLNAILGLTHLLQRSPLTDEQQALAGDVAASGRTLLALINNILDFSRVEAGRLELDAVVFRLPELLDAAAALVAAAAREKGLALSVTVDPEAPQTLLGDSLRAQQVLVNLLGNAVKFTASGAVSLRVESAGRRLGRPLLRFVVDDDGPGLPPDRLERLFDAFTQGDASTTRRFGGSGLGLAICRKLAALMGGEVGAENRPNGGARFWFLVPFDAVADVQPNRGGAPVPAGPPRLAGLRILAAEDNKINQDVLRRVLELEGAMVDIAADGRQASTLLIASPEAFDVVLMDIQMPEMDGCDAARRVRAVVGPSAPPIIALTAGALEEERARALASGMCDFIAKPFDLDRMVCAILCAAGRQAAAARPVSRRQAAPQIPGVETEEALQRMGGDRDLQDRVMRGFVEQLGDAAERAQADWAAGLRLEAAGRLHGLKGAAANIGAVDMAAAAARVERLLRREPPAEDEVNAGLAALAAQMAALRRDIAAALEVQLSSGS